MNNLILKLKSFLNTPPLWEANCFLGLNQFDFPSVDLEKVNISSKKMLDNETVLGKQMERIFEILISHSKNYKILDHNFQIHNNKITLGEIDFLLENIVENQFFHIEMVYKFYVLDPEIPGYNGWIGPNRRDSLLRKINKLNNKQFPLLNHPLTKKYLENIGLSASQFQQQVCFKALLFLPKNANKKNLFDLNENCVAGYWLHFQEFDTDFYKNQLFFCPNKLDWPLPPENASKWIPFSEVKEQITYFFSKNKSPLIWMKTADFKIERFFVVFW